MQKVTGTFWPYRRMRGGCPVTIILGIKTELGILVASDSQTTYGSSKRMDARKISEVRFKDGGVALVAQAGSAITGGRSVEILTDLAKEHPLGNPRALADLAGVAMRRLKDEMKAQQGDCSMGELHEFILKGQLDCELMLAYYVNETPYIYMIDLSIGIATREESFYAVCGCGASIASFLMRDQINVTVMGLSRSLALAIHVIEQVKDADAFCGGYTKVGFLTPRGVLTIFDQGIIEQLVVELKKFDKELLEHRSDQLWNVIFEVEKLSETVKDSTIRDAVLAATKGQSNVKKENN